MSNTTDKGRPTNESGLATWRGDTLRMLRIDRGWSAQRLADEVGVGKTTLLRWENSNPRSDHPDQNQPHAEQVRLLAQLLRVPQYAFTKRARITLDD